MFNSAPFNSYAVNDEANSGNKILLDTANGAESLAITSVITITDTGVGEELVFIGDILGVTESGTGVDVATLAVDVTLTDVATGNDVPAVLVTLSTSETGSGADTVTVASTVSIADTAVGIDSLPAVIRTIVLQETGTAVEVFAANFSTVSLEGNKLNPDTYLELFDFDASMLLDKNGNAGTVSYFTNTPTGGGMSPLLWRTNGYYPLPFEVSGVESRGDGTAMARPTIAISNVNQFLLAAVLSLGDLVGMKVTRWRTFHKFTDNGQQPNINMHYPVDEWIVTRKIAHSKSGISFEMSNALDRPGLRLPRKQILTDQGFPGVSKVRLR